MATYRCGRRTCARFFSAVCRLSGLNLMQLENPEWGFQPRGRARKDVGKVFRLPYKLPKRLAAVVANLERRRGRQCPIFRPAGPRWERWQSARKNVLRRPGPSPPSRMLPSPPSVACAGDGETPVARYFLGRQTMMSGHVLPGRDCASSAGVKNRTISRPSSLVRFDPPFFACPIIRIS